MTAVGAPTPIQLGESHLDDIALRGVPVPAYDRARLVGRIVHVGVGGFHRAHFAVYVHELASAGADWGIVGLGLLPDDAKMADALGSQDHLYTLVEKGNGEPSAAVIGSIIGFVYSPPGQDQAVADLIASPTTAILSLTVTEAGYDEPTPEQETNGARTTFDRIASALAARRASAAGPLTILSFDNISGNGAAARRATLSAAERLDAALPGWVEENCHLPELDGRSHHPRDRPRGPRVAARVEWHRGPLAGGGRAVPAVGRRGRLCGGPPTLGGRRRALHRPRARLGALQAAVAERRPLVHGLPFRARRHYIRPRGDGCARDPDVRRSASVPRGDAHPRPDSGPSREDYIASVLERFANHGVRDQIARLCIDGTAKFPTFLVPTIARQLELDGPLERGATALAGWARYLGVVDPAHQAVDASGDKARQYGAAALSEPLAFLDYGEVFPPALKRSARFRAAFSDS